MPAAFTPRVEDAPAVEVPRLVLAPEVVLAADVAVVSDEDEAPATCRSNNKFQHLSQAHNEVER